MALAPVAKLFLSLVDMVIAVAKLFSIKCHDNYFISNQELSRRLDSMTSDSYHIENHTIVTSFKFKIPFFLD